MAGPARVQPPLPAPRVESAAVQLIRLVVGLGFIAAVLYALYNIAL